jgi:ribosome-associated translation inhibitor RaiA
MAEKNPYVINFGRVPNQYISRDYLIDSIVESLESEIVEEQAFKLTGIRGTGKTVTLTSIERKIRENNDWIVIGLKSNSNIIKDLVAELYSQVPFISSFVDANLNLSAFGIGLNIEKKSPVASIDYALKLMLKEVKKQKKRVLVTIDEARKTEELIDFIQEFQILIREDLPLYVVVAGLYEDIEALENTDGLTFFLRATKYEMQPLNLTIIRSDYMKTIGVTEEVATEMAVLTKGYAFAYQALGKYMWDNESKELTEEVLAKFDDALSDKVYKKIWSELAPKDKWFLQFIVQKDKMSATELLEITKAKHNEWSLPRVRLSEKGIINTQNRGEIRVNLPRFKEFVDNQILLGMI